MKCNKCNYEFINKENCVNRINGEKVTVCPECGNEELYEKIPWDSNRCQICGDFMSVMNAEHVCQSCKIKYKF